MRLFGYHLHPKRLNCWGNALSAEPTSNPFQNDTLVPGHMLADGGAVGLARYTAMRNSSSGRLWIQPAAAS